MSLMRKVQGLFERGKQVRRLEWDLLIAVRDRYTINHVFRKLTRKQQRISNIVIRHIARRRRACSRGTLSPHHTSINHISSNRSSSGSIMAVQHDELHNNNPKQHDLAKGYNFLADPGIPRSTVLWLQETRAEVIVFQQILRLGHHGVFCKASFPAVITMSAACICMRRVHADCHSRHRRKMVESLSHVSHGVVSACL